MQNEFKEDLSLNLSPLDHRCQDFDWEAIHYNFEKAGEADKPETRLAEAVLGVLQMLLPPLSTRRIQPESLGIRLIALAWVLDPANFNGSPSLRKLARRCGIRSAALANHTGHFSRVLGFRNRGQRHAWNWLEKGAPKQRGGRSKARNATSQANVANARNVPPYSKGPVSDSESQPGATDGGVAPIGK